MVSAPSTGSSAAAAAGKLGGAQNASAASTPAKSSSYPVYAQHIPLSMRQAPPLDMSTVEVCGTKTAVKDTPRLNRPHGLKEAPTFRPSEEEWQDPMAYMQKIAPEGKKYGIAKIIPPESWKPPFAIDTERFHFRTRRQELNSVEGSTRTNLNYLDQLAKFHKQHGMNLNRFPMVDKRPLDLYKLKKAVEARGGFDAVCKLKKWAEIVRDLGYSGKIMSSLSTSLKNSYQKWLQPYEEYLRVAKPGVQHQLELEQGGPYTPSPTQSPVKKTPGTSAESIYEGSPTTKVASQLKFEDVDPGASPAPNANTLTGATPLGFIPANLQPAAAPPSTGFTPVNLTPASFQAVNHTTPQLRWEHTNGTSTPSKHANSADAAKTSSTGKAVNGTGKGLKRTISHEAMNGCESPSNDEDSINGRRSKRVRKENSGAPTVVGSHMSLLRPLAPSRTGLSLKAPARPLEGKPGERCEGCGAKENPTALIICESCDNGYHQACLDFPPKSGGADWHCPRCLVGTGEFGFEEGGIYSLKQFQEKANNFKRSYFEPKMRLDAVLGRKVPVTEDEVEKEFWRLVENLTETVEVEYGADIHSTTHGSGFPDAEKSPLDPYSTDPWNLNIMPLLPESLFRHIKSDISGMTVPWLYVGMCFSTFCWHNEDHYTYSANYQHFGDTKTWYGIPGADAERFERAMKEAVPELFEQQPDLLFQLVTLLPPNQLQKAGVNVYAIDQRAGQFVITFPQAYHAGFNHGFNFNEAVNFAPNDWEPFGEMGVNRLQEFRRQPCFSHDELLMTAASRDNSIKSAMWLGPALQRMRDRELQQRSEFIQRHVESSPRSSLKDEAHDCRLRKAPPQKPLEDETCSIGFHHDEGNLPEDEYQCSYCKAYCYLSRLVCKNTNKVLCLLHAGKMPCCEDPESARYTNTQHDVYFRQGNVELGEIVDKIQIRARIPATWEEKLNEELNEKAKPSLKKLKTLLNEGERIQWDLPGLPDLKVYVDKCEKWVEDATNFTARKQQNRRKNERVWRQSRKSTTNEADEREKESRKLENLSKLIAEAEQLSFEDDAVTRLRERAQEVADFQSTARSALQNPSMRLTEDLEKLVEDGKGYNLDLPEIDLLEKLIKQIKWNDKARDMQRSMQDLDEVTALIQEGRDLGVPENDKYLVFFQEQKAQGEQVEAKSNDLIKAEPVHLQQLESLASQMHKLPVSKALRTSVDAILAKQREMNAKVMAMYEGSKERDLRKRPRYTEVREVLDTVSQVSKPNGMIDLEKEVRRHEDWMRRGKKLFGKSNAPLHILGSHMAMVKEHNEHCLDLLDKPRMPVEPASREQTPTSDSGEQGTASTRDVFCLCRQPESGMMIECELCHEWYHGKCLKIARGKFKSDDKYTCPVCDWRVKIPRDAARPKLEDLITWQDEIPGLPFQPEEEDLLDQIVWKATEFRDFLRPAMNLMTSSPEEVNTQRFYLRKIEGAEILLAYETNFLRQELHKWAPVAPEPPPILEHSLSTRKPRPTKQQKLMKEMGIENPEDLPQQYRTKAHTFKPKTSDTKVKPPQPLQPAPHLSRGSSTPNSHTLSAVSDGRGHSFNTPVGSRPGSQSIFAAITASTTAAPADITNPSPTFGMWSSRGGLGDSAAASPGVPQSPIYRPSTPPTKSGGPLDPHLFSPTRDEYGALREGSTGNQNLGGLASPMRDAYPVHHSHSNSGGTSTMDNLFADFTNDDGDGVGRNEAGEEMAALGFVGGSDNRESERDRDELEEAAERRRMEEYLNV